VFVFGCAGAVFNMLKLISILTGYVVLLLPVCSGLYFHISETERKCFIEEIPDETTVIGV
jgi:hypothetical protein